VQFVLFLPSRCHLQRPCKQAGLISSLARKYVLTVLQETLGYKMSSTTPREYRDAFVARVRQARTDAGYTQRAVAMLLGVDASTYNNYERGRGKEPPTLMPLHLIERFSVLCQVQIDWLVTGKEPRRRRGLRKSQKQKQQLNLFGGNQKRV
jgi:transcriptional regulator with XRE-family HTH domain